MRARVLSVVLWVATVGCASEPNRNPPDPGGDEGGSGGASKGGSSGRGGGGAPSTGGQGGGGGGSALGGSSGSGGASGQGGGSGGASSGGSSGAGGSGGAGGQGGSSPADAGDARPAGTDVAAAVDTSGGPPGMTAPGQGPTALGKIVYSQDFENGMEGMSRSPANLPPERVTIVDDPVGKRGKVVKIIWQAGDNYRTSPGTQPRSWFSNAMGYQVKPGTKVSYAWGFMWTDVAMDAFFAQNIGPGPVWEARVRANGRFQILCNQCGGNSPDMMMLVPNRWYDFRVDMDWTGGGKIQFFVDGQMAYQSTMGGASANCHWDGGIYNTPGGTASNKTRTVYLSNLSVGER
jgi:hypothetical protein